jgi:hypothetical protein
MAPKTKKKRRTYTPPQRAGGAGSAERTSRTAASSTTATSRQARKEEARQLREATRRRAARARLLRRVMFGVIAVGLVVVVVAFLTKSSKVELAGKRGVDPGTLPGIQQTDQTKWTNGVDDTLKQRLSAIGLPALPEEAGRLHSDQQLYVYVHGEQVQVPAGIGIGSEFDNAAGSAGPQDFISILHTHDTSGLLHQEAPDQRGYTLGQFFDVWGVYFTRTCLGSLCNDGPNIVRVYSNGQLQDDPRNLVISQTLKSQAITVTYGTESELPDPIPDAFPGT